MSSFLQCAPSVVQLIDRLRSNYGLDFSTGRLQALTDGLSEAEPGSPPEVAAAAILRGGPARLARLLEFVTNGETHVLRHRAQLISLTSLLGRQWAGRWAKPLRIWCAGCSTGEEAYSVAIALHADLPESWSAEIHLLGTDLNPVSIARAERGIYSRWSFREVPEDLEKTYFEAHGNRMHVHPKLRRAVQFQRHNLLEGPPSPVPYDLVLCRNVLIYFDRPATEAALRVFHAALAPGGLLLLGPTEAAVLEPANFRAIPLPDAVVFQKEDPLAPQSLPPAELARARAAKGGRPVRRRTVPVPRASEPPPPSPSPPAAPRDPSPTVNDEVEARLLAAATALDRHDVARAGEALQLVLRAHPDVPFGQYLRGRLLELEGARAEARHAYARALRSMADLPPEGHVPGAKDLTVGELVRAIDLALTHLGVKHRR